MNKRDDLIAVCLASLLAWMLVPIARLGVDPHHDGIILKTALDVLSGQVLFRDTFNQYGALSAYLHALALRVSPTLYSMQIMTVGAYAVSLIFFYGIWRMFLPRSLTILACFLFIIFIPTYERDYWQNDYWPLLSWSSVYAMMFQSLAIYALARLIKGGTPRGWALLLGLSAACIFWIRQPVGILTIGCLGVVWPALLACGWKPTGQTTRSIGLKILGSFLLVNLVMVIQLLYSGAWSAWWYQNMVWPSRWSNSVPWSEMANMSMHPGPALGLLGLLAACALPRLAQSLKPDLSRRAMATYYGALVLLLAWQHEWLLRVIDLRMGGWSIVLPLIIVAQSAVSIALAVRRKGPPKSTEFFLIASLAGLSLGSVLQYFPVADIRHIIWALAPAFGLVIYSIWRTVRWPAPALTIVLAAAFLPSTLARYRSGRYVLAQPVVTLQEPAVLRGMRVPPAEARFYGQIVKTLKPVLSKRPDISGALLGHDALYLCFIPNLSNPIPYYVNWAGLVSPELDRLRWQYIFTNRPIIFFLGADWVAVGEFYRKADYVPILYLDEKALEIAIPQELADEIGIGLYGKAQIKRDSANQPLKP